jgi:hypothetical protein
MILKSFWLVVLPALFSITRMVYGNAFTFTQIDATGANQTATIGINNGGQIVGVFKNGSGNHGFLDTGGVFTTIDPPGASGGTNADGINSAGQIVGLFNDGSLDHGFLNSGGIFTIIDPPGTTGGTNVFRINDSGQIVGVFINLGVARFP